MAAVERDTGLSKHTLRVWERRYGFPRPQRNAFGERIYPRDQVAHLRVVKRLMDQGHRPGKIVSMSPEQLRALSERPRSTLLRNAAALAYKEELDNFLDLIKQHRVEELRRQLSNCVLRLGLARFATDVVAQLNAMIQEAVTRGKVENFEERLYAESIQIVLRNGISTIPRPGSAPAVVLLTTFPQETNGIGLLLVEAIFALEGCRCVSLGVQTPIWDIVLAAGALPTDIVALSFSPSLGPNQVTEGLAELRAKLAPTTEIWAAGSNSALDKRPLSGVRRVAGLRDIEGALADWRRNRRSAA
ncbi:MAG TPA: MerR family transcriptional regulator [Burkholderiaceae bacterium]|nr:MerR family transcriptional regulator [Burkholderiaceae bacterium]